MTVSEQVISMGEAQTEKLFALCDRDNKGYLTENDLRTVCPQLDANVGNQS